jgi:hypothetical protein
LSPFLLVAMAVVAAFWTRSMTAGKASEGRPTLVAWRRIDVVGLELLALRAGAAQVRAESTVICIEDGGFRLDHAWELTADWRALSLRIERHGVRGRKTLVLERDGAGWRVDGKRRPDLDAADEPDLSVTPFCNTFVIRRMPASPGASLTVDIAYVNGRDLTVARSRQRYERQARGRFRYVDLGLFSGFEANLQVDDRGLVEHYQNLFERVKD